MINEAGDFGLCAGSDQHCRRGSGATGQSRNVPTRAMMGFGVACPIRYDGKELVELGRNKFAEWSVPAGRYILMNKTASVEVSVAAGETRYVRCTIKTGFMSGRADLQISDEASFTAKSNEFERKEVNAEFTSPDPAY